jgi:2-oxoisovalerate dehydrogenase E2 component (dihydrolipoyl transacylase)
MSITVIRMPDIGEGIAEVEIVEWRVKVGDSVAEDQTLCDVMTEKAAVEVPSPVAGRVLELGGEVGQVMAVGSVLIRIESSGGSADGAPDEALAPAVASKPLPTPSATPPPSPDVPTPPPPAATASVPTTTARAPPAPAAVRATSVASSPQTSALAAPAVRERARTLGIDLSCVKGSGPDGRIVHADLDAAATAHLTPGTRASTHAAAQTDSTREVKLVGLRRAIAQKMLQSKRSIPHFTYVEEIDVTEMVALREELNRQYAVPRGGLSPLALVIRAIVRAVADFPQVNAHFDATDEGAGVLTLYDAVHLGIATQTDGGLMVPVLRQAQTLNLWECSEAIAQLAAKVRAGKATRDELSGSTLTVTSLGKLGGIVSTPVINHPEVAIVGINRIVARPMVFEDTVQVRQMMNLSSSFDHRVVDGAVAARYIQRVRQLLETPAMLFVE